MFFYLILIHAASTDKREEEEIKRAICSQKQAQPPSDQTTITSTAEWRLEKSIGQVAADISAERKAMEKAQKSWPSRALEEAARKG